MESRLYSTIVVFFIIAGLSILTPLWGQSALVTVIDEANTPLIGATVKWQDEGKITDLDGTVSIPTDLAPNTIITFSYIGYESREIPFQQLMDREKFKGLVVVMKESSQELSVITVTAPTKFAERVASVPNVVDKITQEDMIEKGSSTSAEALEDAGVFVQRSQAGGGSPIIRGFEANKVLIVVDGVRMNNAIYRSGHLQNVITVDNAMLEHIEVLHGPSAVVYGSDALGGVLYLESKEPLLVPTGNTEQKDTSQSHAYIRYASANDGITTHFDFGTGNKKIGSISSLTFSRFGDVRSGKRAPNWPGDSIPENWMRRQYVAIVNNDDIVINEADTDPYLQRGTNYGQNNQIGYWQLDFLQKIKWRKNEFKSHVFNFQFSTSNNIQRYDQLSKIRNGKPRFAEWYYGPQRRIMLSHTGRIFKKNKLFDKAIYISAFQNIGEDRYQRKLGRILLERNLLDIFVYSFNMDLLKYLDEAQSHRLYYGTELTHNYVRSYADFIHVVSKERILGNPTRYGNDGNTMSTAALYANYRWDIPTKGRAGSSSNYSPSLFRLLAGLRYTYASTIARYESTNYAPDIPYDRAAIQAGNMTGAIGFSMTPGNSTIKASFATGYRVPNVDDLAKLREKDGFVTIPNPDLQPEYALNYEATVSHSFYLGQQGGVTQKNKDRLTLSATVFLTDIQNAMVRKLHRLPDRDTIIDGTLQTIPGDTTYVFENTEGRVVVNTNAAKARIFGYSLNMDMQYGKFFMNAGYNDIRGNYTAGRIDDEQVEEEIPLSHIPPSYGHLGVGYKTSLGNEKHFRAELLYRFNGVKPLSEYDPTSGNSDNLDDAIEDFGTPKWHTWNLYTTWKFNKKFSLNFNIENINDMHYRVFSSGISAPGRNFIITLRGQF